MTGVGRAAAGSRWAEFCATVVDRIEAIRLEDAAPLCVACGSTTPKRAVHRRCWTCQTVKPIAAFHRNGRARRGGYEDQCGDCANARRAAIRRRDAIAAIRRAS